MRCRDPTSNPGALHEPFHAPRFFQGGTCIRASSPIISGFWIPQPVVVCLSHSEDVRPW